MTACPACFSNRTKRDPFFYQWRDKQWWIMRCADCTHQFVFPLLTREDQRIIYDDHYFLRSGDWACGVFDADYVSSEDELRKEAREALEMLPIQTGTLLDVGCSGGFFLDEARKLGFKVTGIELNERMAEHARNTLGLEVMCQRIEDTSHDCFPDRFDAVVMLDVLEHIPQPSDVLEKVRQWTHPESLLLIRGPLHNDPIARLKEPIRRAVGITKLLPGYPLDVNCFSKRSLTGLLTMHSFKVLAWINERRGFANMLGQRL